MANPTSDSASAVQITPETALDSLPELLTPEEYFRATRIGKTAGYDALRTGQIPSIRVGRQYRIPRSALQV